MKYSKSKISNHQNNRSLLYESLESRQLMSADPVLVSQRFEPANANEPAYYACSFEVTNHVEIQAPNVTNRNSAALITIEKSNGPSEVSIGKIQASNVELIQSYKHLSIEKNVLGSDNSDAQLVSVGTTGSDIKNVDAGDTIRFEIIIKNKHIGRGAGVLVRDQLPQGFEIPKTGLNLVIIRVQGNKLEKLGLDSGQDTDLFTTGLKLKNSTQAIPANLSPTIADNQSPNRFILRYELMASNSVVANTTYASTATVQSFAIVTKGKPWFQSERKDDAKISISDASIEHTWLATDQDHTSGSNVVVGETITYAATIKIPEGSMNEALLTLIAPQGLAIQSVVSVKASSSIKFDGFEASELLNRAKIDSSSTDANDRHNRLQLTVGDLQNTDNNNRISETIEIIYRARVSNDISILAGDKLRSTAMWFHQTGLTVSHSSSVQVVEPKLQVQQSLSQTHAGAGEKIAVEIRINHQPDSVAAFDLNLNGAFGGDEYSLVRGSIKVTGGSIVEVNDGSGTNYRFVADRLAPNGELKINYEITINQIVVSDSTISLTPKLTYHSLAGPASKTYLATTASSLTVSAPASISGSIFIDQNQDAILKSTDVVIVGVDVTLTGITDGGTTIRAITKTNTSGVYKFEGLASGTYRIDTPTMPGLQSFVSNVGSIVVSNGATVDRGVGVPNGFQNIRLAGGAQASGYDIGLLDPQNGVATNPSIYDVNLAFYGTSQNDQFDVSFKSLGATVSVGSDTYSLDASQTRSIRLLGSFGTDLINILGSQNQEIIDLKNGSASITGTWFQMLAYGMEDIRFTGGGGTDLARFYDTVGNESLVANAFNATLTGAGFVNHVEGVKRIYTYFSEGNDSVSLTGQTGVADNFDASPTEAKLYNDNFYLYASRYDSIQAISTDTTDRAYLAGSIGDDQLNVSEHKTSLVAAGINIELKDIHYAIITATQGGNDTAIMTGGDSSDEFRSTPTEARLDIGTRRFAALGFETVEVAAGNGFDTARIFDSAGDDIIDADTTHATITNSINQTNVVGFDRVYFDAASGGNNVATIHGSSGDDVFKAAPNYWSLEGGGSYLFGAGFSTVAGYGSANDKAYLYDSQLDDLVEMTEGTVVMSGQGFHNAVYGFGKVNAEATLGNDRVIFRDTASRSTVRWNEEKATVFSRNFSYNATGFDHLDAYYTDLAGGDGVELDGRIDYQLLAVDVQQATYRLSLHTNLLAPHVTLKKPLVELL